jgi:hypothetical protein
MRKCCSCTPAFRRREIDGSIPKCFHPASEFADDVTYRVRKFWLCRSLGKPSNLAFEWHPSTRVSTLDSVKVLWRFFGVYLSRNGKNRSKMQQFGARSEFLATNGAFGHSETSDFSFERHSLLVSENDTTTSCSSPRYRFPDLDRLDYDLICKNYIRSKALAVFFELRFESLYFWRKLRGYCQVGIAMGIVHVILVINRTTTSPVVGVKPRIDPFDYSVLPARNQEPGDRSSHIFLPWMLVFAVESKYL